MSQNPSNYMEGVPVKISEKYKPPPKVSLPSSVYQRLTSEEILDTSVNYDFSLEHAVIKKIDQWRKFRDGEREARRERLRLKEVEKSRQVEEQQKRLLTAVSYPSAEELSSEDDEGTEAKSPVAEADKEISTQFSPSQQRFDTILKPTIVPDTRNTLNCIALKGSLSKINYSDFENDTSSPFDSVELKTINDLDILAEVLNITQNHSVKSDKTDMQSHLKNTSVDEIYCEQTISNSNDYNTCETSKSQYSENSNSIGVERNLANIGQSPETIDSNYSPNSNNMNAINDYRIQNYANMNGIPKDAMNFYYFNHLPTNQNFDNYIYNYGLNNTEHINYNENVQRQFALNQTVLPQNDDSKLEMYQKRSKSKSVPDIVKELNDEIRDSEQRRARNRSQTRENVEAVKTRRLFGVNRIHNADETFMKLSPSSQSLAKNISLMGFPLERVSKIAEKFGNDDKKIVEHLIPLSELLDLGFEESKISEALLKFDNNKEKALDFLIS